MSDFYPYPPVGFYFQVQFASAPLARDNAFQEVSGLDISWETEEIREGGQNLYKHQVPSVPTHGHLVLKRGFVSSSSVLATWCNFTFASGLMVPIVPVPMVLHLLNADATPLATWTFLETWPVKWSLSEFKAQESGLAIETLEFSYSTFLRL